MCSPPVTVVRTAFVNLAIPTSVARECAALSSTGRLPDGVSPQRLADVVRYYVDCYLPQHTVYARTTGFFLGKGPAELRALLLAARALGAHGLLDHATRHVARLLKGSSPERMLDILGLNADTTGEERRRRLADMAWALPRTA